MYGTTAVKGRTRHGVCGALPRGNGDKAVRSLAERLRRSVISGDWDEAILRAEGLIDTVCWAIVVLSGVFFTSVIVGMF